MRRKIATFLLAGLMLVLAAVRAAAGDSSEPTLADLILADADGRYDWKFWDYDIIGEVVLALIGAAEAGAIETDLLAAAADPDATLTDFLPDDMAFRRLAYDLTGRWIWRESKIIPALVEAVDGDLQLINDIVEYHVVLGIAIDSATAAGADGAVLSTVLGEEIKVKVKHRWWGPAIFLIDKGPDIRNARVDLGDVDNHAVNGIWHGITRVMLPIDA